jgi:hypothetical protein
MPPTDRSPTRRRPRAKLLEIANEAEPVQDGRIHIEKINGPFLFRDGGSPAEYLLASPMPSKRDGCGGMSPALT